MKKEQREKKRLYDQIESLKNEIQKQNFQQFTNATNVSINSGRLPPVPGVREITMEDIEIGEKIG